MTSCDHDVIDVSIIGAGPAGLSAAVYAARAGLNTVIFGNPYEGQLARAGVVENYITWTDSPTGIQIVDKMIAHATKYGADLVEKKIKQIVKNPNGTFHIYDDSGDSYCTNTVILATGTKHKKLGIKGEEEFYAKGVGYCTICDGPLYRDQPIAIVGFGDEAVLASLRMADIASEVYLISTKARIGADPGLVEEIGSYDNVILYEKSKPIEITGNGSVEGLIFKENKNEVSIDVKAVFIEVGVLPSSAIASGLGLMLDGQFILIDEFQATNVPGFFAAGDITNSRVRQAIISAGDGARAAISAIDYIKEAGLSNKKLKTTQWGGTKPESKEEIEIVKTEGNALYNYVSKDEGFMAAYERYTADTEMLSKVESKLSNAKIITISALWCPDCRKNVPRMAKISQNLPWEFEVLDRDGEGVIKKYDIKKIPTFIVVDNEGNEMARIIEDPKYASLEEDLLKIVNKKY
jgi:thioredoxin reductase (NADPH)